MFEDTKLDNNWKLNQNEAPISEAMDKYARDGALAFHTPGHKQGLGAHSLLKRLITEEGLKQEVSLMEELDDLHEPSGCIKQAEALAAELWGARDTMFMINGTTGAIHAMILGTLQPGDKVFVSGDMMTITEYFRFLGRNKHKIRSVMLLGGGRISYYLSRLIVPMGIHVTLFEINPVKARTLSEQLPKVDVIVGDGSRILHGERYRYGSQAKEIY